MIKTRKVVIEETCIQRDNRLWEEYQKAVKAYRLYRSVDALTRVVNALRDYREKRAKVVTETFQFSTERGSMSARLTETQAKAAREMIAEGLSVRSIASTLNVKAYRVRQCLNENEK